VGSLSLFFIMQVNALLIGTILGDGHVQKTQSKTEKCRLRISHSLEQKDYVDWKFSQLQNLCSSLPKYDEKKNSYQFYTDYSADLKLYHDLFYEKNEKTYRKVIRPLLKNYLTDPISLAVWYCDDGSKRTDCDACRIATHSFSLEEIKILQAILLDNFEIRSHIVKAGRSKKGNYQWYSLSLSARDGGFHRLRELIFSYVESKIPSMMYKLEVRRPRND
jgi:hypothetical protein